MQFAMVEMQCYGRRLIFLGYVDKKTDDPHSCLLTRPETGSSDDGWSDLSGSSVTAHLRFILTRLSKQAY